jgi:hypothetical protein
LHYLVYPHHIPDIAKQLGGTQERESKVESSAACGCKTEAMAPGSIIEDDLGLEMLPAAEPLDERVEPTLSGSSVA